MAKSLVPPKPFLLWFGQVQVSFVDDGDSGHECSDGSVDSIFSIAIAGGKVVGRVDGCKDRGPSRVVLYPAESQSAVLKGDGFSGVLLEEMCCAQQSTIGRWDEQGQEFEGAEIASGVHDGPVDGAESVDWDALGNTFELQVWSYFSDRSNKIGLGV